MLVAGAFDDGAVKENRGLLEGSFSPAVDVSAVFAGCVEVSTGLLKEKTGADGAGEGSDGEGAAAGLGDAKENMGFGASAAFTLVCSVVPVEAAGGRDKVGGSDAGLGLS